MLRKRFIIYKISRSIQFCIIKNVFFGTYELRKMFSAKHIVQEAYMELDILEYILVVY